MKFTDIAEKMQNAGYYFFSAIIVNFIPLHCIELQLKQVIV